MNRLLVMLSCSMMLVAGCVVFPARHAIFVPEASLGKREDSDPCGWLYNNEDLLVISTAEYHMQVRAYVNSEDDQLTVFIRIVPALTELAVDFGKLQVLPLPPGKTPIAPSTVTRHEYGTTIENARPVRGPQILQEGTRKFFIMTYPASPGGLAAFSLEFQDGAFVPAERRLRLVRIGFRKVRNWDIYFGSINC